MPYCHPGCPRSNATQPNKEAGGGRKTEKVEQLFQHESLGLKWILPIQQLGLLKSCLCFLLSVCVGSCCCFLSPLWVFWVLPAPKRINKTPKLVESLMLLLGERTNFLSSLPDKKRLTQGTSKKKKKDCFVSVLFLVQRCWFSSVLIWPERRQSMQFPVASKDQTLASESTKRRQVAAQALAHEDRRAKKPNLGWKYKLRHHKTCY